MGDAVNAPFVACEVVLKGYEAPTTAWAASFDELREYLGPQPR